MSKVIFISGASRGFGKLWAEAFLKDGHSVIATARKTDTLSDLVKQYGEQLLPLQLDVNDREAAVAAINKAADHFGRIDVLINNAGYGQMGAVEEVSEEQARGVMDTNFFGLLWLTQAVLPIMRAQKSGHIIQVASVLGLVTWPTIGLYNASKYAVEGLSETLAQEVKDFGVHVTVVEPGPYATDFGTASAVHATAIPAYDDLKAGFYAAISGVSLGKPEATVDAIVTLVNSDNPPLHFLLGKDALPLVKQEYQNRLDQWEAWQEVAVAAHGN
jgi:NAD(P)-dependent dehydrogenase (short-subunit alcohol dehydrogenase family)